eukprot:9501053-Pyramimonas_sp.AAC.1
MILEPSGSSILTCSFPGKISFSWPLSGAIIVRLSCILSKPRIAGRSLPQPDTMLVLCESSWVEP